MANRFTVTEKWSDPWFRRLAVNEKLLFMYFCDVCDIAGFVEIDEDQIAFQTGVESSAISGAIEGLNRGFIVRDGIGWVKNFVRHQKNLPINAENNAHKAIINALAERVALFPEVQELAPDKPLTRGLGKGKGKGKGKGIGGTGERGPKSCPLPDDLAAIPGMPEAWDTWQKHRREIKEPLTPTSSEQQFKTLRKSPNPVDMILTSVQNGWQGLFPVKNPTTNGTAAAPADAYAEIDAF
jgi:hypothetical protein